MNTDDTRLEELARECACKLPQDVLEHPMPFPTRLDYATKFILAALHKAVEPYRKEVDNLSAATIHTCHDHCQRIECVQRRHIQQLQAENEALKAQVQEERIAFIKLNNDV